jgi:hypothetical protein
MERFLLSKNCTCKKWIITDNQSDPAEDSIIYTFDSKKKAQDFKSMMEIEYPS